MKAIPKYFVGGVTVNIPIGFPSLTATHERTAAGDKSDSSESGSKKSFIEQIFDPKAKMLASDATLMAQLAEQAGNLEGSPQFSTLSKSQQFAAIYSQYITRASMAQNNYESLKEAKQKLIDKGAAQEVAISSEGLMFVHKNGSADISLIDPRAFNPGKDISVTNAELTNLRANDPRFAFNDKLLNTVMAATSMEEIRKVIKDATTKLESVTEENSFFVNPLFDRDEKALKALQQAHITEQDLQTMDLGTLLKVKVKGEDNIVQIEHALNTIWAQLTPQQKALLTIRAKEVGGQTTPLTIITEYLSTMRKVDTSFTLDVENTFSSGNVEARTKRLNAEKKQEESTLDKMPMSEAAAFLAGYGNMKEHRFSNGSRGNIMVTGNDTPITKGNTNVGRINAVELQTTNFSGILDLNNISIGGTVIPLSSGEHIMVDGNTLVQAALPVDKAALAQNKIIPDLEACLRLQQAWKEIKQSGITNPTAENAGQINAILQKYSLPAMFVGIENGQPVLAVTEYQYFGVLNGYVDGAALPKGGTFNAALEPLKDQEADSILRQFKERSKGYVGAKTGGFLGFGQHPDLYKGTVFIPLRVDMNNAYSGSGIHPSTAQRENMARREIHKNSQKPEVQQDRYNVNYNLNYR